MATAGNEYSPSASERVRDQVARYEASDGSVGGDLTGRPIVILTARGASSGAIRKTPIMRVVDGDAYVAIASYAGNPHNPARTAISSRSPTRRSRTEPIGYESERARRKGRRGLGSGRSQTPAIPPMPTTAPRPDATFPFWNRSAPER
jgi:hypothetical protein